MDALKYLLLFITACSFGQKDYLITGIIPQAAGKEITLQRYNISISSTISKTIADKNGKFSLNYPATYSGAGLLEIKGTKSAIVLLNRENFSVRWTSLEDFTSFKFMGSPENDAFAEGMAVNQMADRKKAGLLYLLPLYAGQPQEQSFIDTELEVQEKSMSAYLASLPENSYARYYLKLRKFHSDSENAIAGHPINIDTQVATFKAIDFSDVRLLASGIFSDILYSYFVMLESYEEEPYMQISTSADAVLQSLNENPELKQDVAALLFKHFEKRSLFTAAEHIALSMLNGKECTLGAEQEALFEQYRKMAKGNNAPEILFVNSNNSIKQLSDVVSKYKLVIFGASWCPTCQEEVPHLLSAYKEFKATGLEIVYISLDTDKKAFTDFTQNFPWIAASDLKGWEGKAPRDYFIAATPTMYLLDSSNKILLKPSSLEQLSAWLINKQ